MTTDGVWNVYIIECQDGSYYTGMTSKLSDRFEQHLSHLGSKYTGQHGVRKLVHLETYETMDEARTREIQIKSWSRWKKEKLISGEWRQP
jgi:putative endonuclease